MKNISRRKFIAVSSIASGGAILAGVLSVKASEKLLKKYSNETMKKTFTILHTNDMHSSLIGMGPSSDYSPFVLNDDKTVGGFARLAGLISRKKEELKDKGPVLILDAGDYSMGTPFGAANRETGGELQLMSLMGYDATTFGNHEFDLGPEGLGKSISMAAKAGRIPLILSSNTKFDAAEATLTNLRQLLKEGIIKRYEVFERGGTRFGIFGVLGKEAIIYTNGGAVEFPDATETAKEIVNTLRETEKVDVVICLSHGGLEKDKDGKFTDGDDVRIAKEVPGIDIVISGHSHTTLQEAIIVNGRTPVVQAGLESKNLGELIISLDGEKLSVDSYKLYPIDDNVLGDEKINLEIEKLKKSVTSAVFSSRGYSIDQPLAIVSQDMPNTFTDIKAGTPLANLCTDAYRKATHADIGFTANGMMRAGLTRGKTGVQTVYDVFAVAPLGAGIIDTTAGSALVTAYFTGKEIKNILEFFLMDNPAHPGEYFPRVSGMRFRYNMTRPMLDVVTAIELGDFEKGYHSIDISGNDETLYSLTCPLMLGTILIAIPKYTKGKLTLVPKKKNGQKLTSKVDALDDPRKSTAYLLSPKGTVDKGSIETGSGKDAVSEIKEWQAIMDFLCRLPIKGEGKLPIISIDEKALEIRALKEN